MDNQLKELADLKQLLKTNDVLKAVEDLQKKTAELSKADEAAKKQGAQSVKGDLAKSAEEVNGVQLIAQKVNLDAASAKDVAFQLKKEIDNLFLVLGAESNGKATLTVAISDNLVKDKGLDAGAIVSELAKEIKGGGGGQPFFATAGGQHAAGLDSAIAKARDFLSKKNLIR